MPEHGEPDESRTKWFCGYWMSEDEWNDIHDYRAEGKTPNDEEVKDDSDE